MTFDSSMDGANRRIKGLDHEELMSLKIACEHAIKDIEAGGMVDMWAVSDGYFISYWDTSYPRACQFLINQLNEAKKSKRAINNYEIRKMRVLRNELNQYEESYGYEWKQLQAQLDSEGTEAA